MTHQKSDQTVQVTVNDGKVYILDSSPEITVASILIEDLLPHECDNLKLWMNNDSLQKVWNDVSIIERIFNSVLQLTNEAKGGQELVSLNELRRELELVLNQDELKSQSLEILEETFADELENELQDDPIAQCIEHTVLVLEFMGVLDPVYETPYGDDNLGKLAGTKLTKVGRVIRALLYEDRWTINRPTKQPTKKARRKLTESMKQEIRDAMHPGVPLKSLRF